MHLRHGLQILTIALIAIGSTWSSQAAAAAESSAVLPWSLELEQRLQPWCPNGCKVVEPFTAVYEKQGRVLVFVGVRHVYDSKNNVIRAVDSGFAATSPAIVILEGFPAAMGENPPPLVESARSHGTPQADGFARSEAMYAASLALQRGIPFMGGEPTRAQQVEALERKGYQSTDIAFSYILGGLSQSLRSGDIASTSDPKLTEAFAQWARAFADQYQLEPMSFEDFRARYRSVVGVELTRDTELVAHAAHADVGAPPAIAAFHRADTMTRDEHLLATIEKELASKKRVLVVYGASHWTTLARALERELGKPKITPFLE